MISAPSSSDVKYCTSSKDRESAAAFFCRFTHRDEEVGQVDLDVAAVRRALFGIDVEANLDVCVLDLERSEEPPKYAEPSLRFVAGTRESIQLVENGAKVRR